MKKNLCLIFPLIFSVSACFDTTSQLQEKNDEATGTAVIETLENGMKSSRIDESSFVDKSLNTGYSVVFEKEKTAVDNAENSQISSQKQQEFNENINNFHDNFVKDIQSANENIQNSEIIQALSEKLEKNSEEYKKQMLTIGKALMKQEINKKD